jgi:two-component system sensor histidine kinase MtrB
MPRWRVPLRRWRRSLQLRVVVTTVAVTLLVVGGLGVLLLDQVVHGLLTAKYRSALSQTNAGLLYAENVLADDPSESVDAAVEQITFKLAHDGAGDFAVYVLPQAAGQPGYEGGTAFDPAEVSPAVQRVVTGRQVFASTYVRALVDGRVVPALLVGAPLVAPNGDTFGLYYSFPLTAEQQTLDVVRRSVEFGGLALVALLALLVAYLTRQVLTPVRLAAEAADRLAAGRLSERLAVRGEDELARLGRAFNSMAAGLQRQIRELSELSRLQQRFTSDVSHELRTPLTTVRMAADVLHGARADFPPAVARSAELLQGELNRFEGLLVDLLEISRFDAGGAVLEPEPVDLGALVAEEVARARPLADARGCALLVEPGPAADLLAELDARRVRRIVRNLLTNAVEHGDGAPVQVCLAADDTCVAVRVRDRGVGLRPGESSLVFQRFWRADPSRARLTGGTGLGLAIALEDARLHGGWLQAWGEPGLGSVFRLVLPRVAGGEVRVSPLPLDPDAPAEPDPTVAPEGRSAVAAQPR